jgi:predicted Fe-S protein YdhL (DUF1289 family)
MIGAAMLSPCRKICVYDSLRDLCAGCGRRLEEIENWLEMSEVERAAIMAELPLRLKPEPPASAS